MSRLMIFDSTLRDGNHAVKHQLSASNIKKYCQAMDGSGVKTIIVGHGNGLGASSLQVGLAALDERTMLQTAKANLEKTRLGVYMIPGFGTIEDNLKPAIADGAEVFEIGCHCTEADTTREHIEFLRNQGKETYGVLMMTHMASPERLLEECQKMQSYGALGVILMDSAGAFTMERVRWVISRLYNGLDIHIGFHPHNNMGIAVANACIAIEEGADIIDGTLRGFGAGAGNCQLEDLVALLEKSGKRTGINFYRMLDASEKVMPELMNKDMGQDPISIVSGQAGVFSAFRTHVINAARAFEVDPRDILVEVGKRKAVGGQEDMVVEIAKQLSCSTNNDSLSYQLSSLL
ncbi:4-hydroxy-2-oxovalerate aldolase [Acetatifactor aquisgranensis]|uniref:4-hydroxy-2-oxovalerate aldolase n=1 Tax=Acetatifactor aquisgranensis TaxID=2941233 RepID=UPI00203A986F|nr:4-hydroxy-2-oxovalerate aldolase [Acetatifactor aquisgranensis]